MGGLRRGRRSGCLRRECLRVSAFTITTVERLSSMSRRRFSRSRVVGLPGATTITTVASISLFPRTPRTSFFATWAQEAFSDVTAGDLRSPGMVEAWGGRITIGMAISTSSWPTPVGQPSLPQRGFGRIHGPRNTVLPTEPPPGVAWGDYDKDGDPDLFLASNPSLLFRNDAGTFIVASVGNIAISKGRLLGRLRRGR